MSVLKENKCLACPQNQQEDPCEAEQFIDRKTAENGEQGLQQADKKIKVRLSNKILSSFSGRPEGNSASYIHGLVQSVFYILHKCVLNYRLVMLHWV